MSKSGKTIFKVIVRCYWLDVLLAAATGFLLAETVDLKTKLDKQEVTNESKVSKA